MNKKEAVAAMIKGSKVTHKEFKPNDWIKINVEGYFEFQDEKVIPCSQFWLTNNGPEWDNGWNIFFGGDKKGEGFINESGLKFNDISSETEREYRFPNGNVLHIGNPLYLHVSKSGGHRLYTEDGWCYYVQPREGWSIRWKVKEGKPSFVK